MTRALAINIALALTSVATGCATAASGHPFLAIAGGVMAVRLIFRIDRALVG